MRTTCTVLALLLLAGPAPAAERSSAQTRAFQRANPCPANGARRGPCPGHVIDHKEPLCAGGLDVPENMQWQTIAEAKAKDIEEHRQCRALRQVRARRPAEPHLPLPGLPPAPPPGS